MKVIIKRSDDDDDLTGQHTFFFTVSQCECVTLWWILFPPVLFFLLQTMTLANKKTVKGADKKESKETLYVSSERNKKQIDI